MTEIICLFLVVEPETIEEKLAVDSVYALNNSTFVSLSCAFSICVLYYYQMNAKRGQKMISAALAILETEEERNELSDFYEKYKNRFYAIAFERLHNEQDSEDAIQETFLRSAIFRDYM